MYFKKPLKTFLFPAANILLAIFLLTAFTVAAQNVIETFPVAHMSSLTNLAPQPMDYLWKFNEHQAPLDKKRLRYYADYYEDLLQNFPGLFEIYGLLGYCYHYMGDDNKAIYLFQKAISSDRFYSWNYYDLAAIYISHSRFHEASILLQEIQAVSLRDTITRIYASKMVYLPLVDPGGNEGLILTVDRIKQSYKDSFILVQLLDHAGKNDHIATELKHLKLDLYAF